MKTRQKSICHMLVLTVLSLTLFVGCGKVQEKPVVGPRPVKMLEIQTGQKAGLAEYSGRIKSENQVDLSFEIQGKIVKLPVGEGDKVKKGALLIQLDQRDVAASLASAKADFTFKK